MTNEQILRWMLEFGTGWVPSYRLRDTWAWEELWLSVAERRGHIISGFDMKVGSIYYRLTPKAIKQVTRRRK